MKRWIAVLLFSITLGRAGAQEISIPELYQLLDTNPDLVDTLLAAKKYQLWQKEADSVSVNLYFTHLQKNGTDASWVRSVTYTEISNRGLSSRLVVYRTYRKKEYEDIRSWLFRNGFKTSKQFSLGSVEHIIYTEGKRSILLKLSRQPLPSGVLVNVYEVEIGK